MTTSVRIHNRMFYFPQTRYWLIKHTVYQICIRAYANCPSRQHTIEAIQNQKQVDFLRRNGKSGDVRKPFPVWFLCMDVSLQYLRNCRGNLALVRTVFSTSFIFTTRSSSCIILRTIFSKRKIPFRFSRLLSGFWRSKKTSTPSLIFIQLKIFLGNSTVFTL